MDLQTGTPRAGSKRGTQTSADEWADDFCSCVMDSHGQEVNSQACVWKGRRLFLHLSIRTTNGRFLGPQILGFQSSNFSAATSTECTENPLGFRTTSQKSGQISPPPISSAVFVQSLHWPPAVREMHGEIRHRRIPQILEA
jgi:hypothetical protein